LARFVKGDVIVVPFPFSDLSQAKRRPALVVAAPGGDDIILCQITSQAVRDTLAVPLRRADFQSGGLRLESNVRPNRLFTADSALALYSVGHLTLPKLNEVVAAIVRILSF